MQKRLHLYKYGALHLHLLLTLQRVQWLLNLFFQARDCWHELAGTFPPPLGCSFLLEVAGCFDLPAPSLSRLSAYALSAHLPTRYTQFSGSFLHMPVISLHLYTSPWSHDHRMTQEEKEFKILGRLIRKPPTSCTGTRLVGNHACWGGIWATRTGSARRRPGSGEIYWFLDEPIRERE